MMMMLIVYSSHMNDKESGSIMSSLSLKLNFLIVMGATFLLRERFERIFFLSIKIIRIKIFDNDNNNNNDDDDDDESNSIE